MSGFREHLSEFRGARVFGAPEFSRRRSFRGAGVFVKASSWSFPFAPPISEFRNYVRRRIFRVFCCRPKIVDKTEFSWNRCCCPLSVLFVVVTHVPEIPLVAGVRPCSVRGAEAPVECSKLLPEFVEGVGGHQYSGNPTAMNRAKLLTIFTI